MDALSATLGLGGLVSNIIGNQRQQSNFERQLGISKYQYEDLKHYNSMPEQVQRMRAAGLNPAFMQGSLDASMAQQVTQPAAPSYQPLDLGGLSSLGNSIALNDSKRDLTESEVQINHLRSFAQEFENALNVKFADREREGALNEQGTRIMKLANEALLAAAEGDYKQAEISLAKAQEYYYYAAGSHEHAEYRNEEALFPWIVPRVKAYIRNLQSQSNYNNSSARNQRSLAKLNEQEYSIKSDPEVIDSLKRTFVATADKLESDRKLGKTQRKMVEQLIKRYEKENDVFYLELALKHLENVGATAADVFMLKKKIGALADLGEASRTNAETKRQDLELRRSKANSTDFEEEWQYDRTGKARRKSVRKRYSNRRN